MRNPGYMLAAEGMDRRLECANLPEGWAALGGVVVMLALLYVVTVLYRRERRAGASAKVRGVLAGLRCTVLILLAGVWVQPIVATYIHRRYRSLTLLLADGSASMSLRDRYPDPEDARRATAALQGVENAEATAMTRAELMRAVLARHDAALLWNLAARNPVRMYRFGEQLEPLGEVVAEQAASQPAGGGALDGLTRAEDTATDIGRAVRQAIESNAGTPIAAVVVFSDGRFNRGEPADVVARVARSRKIPIHAIGVGDPAPPRNVILAAVEAPANVFVKDPFTITAYLKTQGLPGARVNVELLERRGGDRSAAVLDTKSATVGPDGQVAPVVFRREIGTAAEIVLEVRVPPQDGEMLTDDNAKEVTVRALDVRMRVLLVAGGPSWEYRYLSRLLERDATVNVSCWLQSADDEAVRDGKTVIDKFPTTEEELAVYDCIVLLDPQPRDFDPPWAERVESLVANAGGGLLYVAGRKNAPRFAHDPDTRPVIDMLPVVVDPGEADLLINEQGHFQATAWPLMVPPAVAGHPLLALSEQPGENTQIWARLPGVYWHYPVRREKPVATVFLRHSNPRMRNAYGGHVLLATQFLGAGRTGFLAYDGTWRWRRLGDRYFNRFWIQLLRHMVEGKLVSGQKRGLIQLERERCTVGEAVAIEARLLDARHLPMQQEHVEASILVDGKPERSITLDAQPNRPGWYRGQIVPSTTGTHVVQIDLPGGNGRDSAAIRGELRVGKADLEFRRTELDRQALEVLASQSAGGRYLDIDEVDQLPALIPSRTASLVLTGQPITLWDRWWTWAVLVTLLGIEWAVRKRAHLL